MVRWGDLRLPKSVEENAACQWFPWWCMRYPGGWQCRVWCLRLWRPLGLGCSFRIIKLHLDPGTLTTLCCAAFIDNL